jgi:hypothetical protein
MVDRVEELLLQWEEGRGQGSPPAAEELCASCPELLAEVREEIRKLELAAAACAAASPLLADPQPTLTPAPTPNGLDTLPHLPAGGQIGRYRLLELLGAGGMGNVYRAYDPQLDRFVAVKVPRFSPDQHARAQAVQRFLRESRAAAQVRHPNICPIYDVGEQDDTPYLVMAYIAGPSLSQRLQEGPPDVASAVALCRKMASALAAVHTAGILHRDLKPGNILLDGAGEPLLTDFGLARSAGAAEPLTQEGMVVGTPAYMPPEQARGQDEEIGPWTDVYSLGVVLYQLLTGRLPLAGRHASAPEGLPPPSRWRPEVDAALDAVVLRALARRPEERYQTAAEFAQALEDWSTRGVVAGPVVGAEQATTTDARAVAGRQPQRRGVVGLAAVVLATAVTAVFVVIGRDRVAIVPSGPEKGPVAAEPRLVKKLQVKHLKDAGDHFEWRTIGVEKGEMRDARFDDKVQVEAEFSEPVYAFLLAFNPNGKEQLCLPNDPGQRPDRRDRLDYPEGDEAFRLNDGVGLQAFVVVASRQPLPAYDEWKAQRPGVDWMTLRPKEGAVWRGDGERLEPLTRHGDDRGEVVKLEGLTPLKELWRTLRRSPGIDALEGVAFLVLPKKGGK